MLATLLPILVSTAVSTSSKIAVDSLVKLATPSTVSTISKYGIKVGAALLGVAVAHKASKFASDTTEEVIAIVSKPGEIEKSTLEISPGGDSD